MTKLGNLMILGDSYSTYKGYNPEGYAVWYTPEGRPQTDLRLVEDTWWYRVLDNTDSSLVLNSSYSGTTICNTGYGGTDYKSISFVGRFDKRCAEGFFKEQKIDTLLIFGGTNDTWAGSPLGELKLSGHTPEELYSVLPAFGYLLSRVKSELPDTRVIVLINDVLSEGITEGMITACRALNVEYLPLVSITKNEGHPTIRGMKEIAEQLLAYLEKSEN